MRIRTVYGQLQHTAARFPDGDLLVVPDRLAEAWRLDRTAWRYGELLAAVDTLAARYRGAGYGTGHRVALLLENRPHHFLHFLALNAIGASMVPLNPDYEAQELRYVLEHSESALLVAARDCLARCTDAAAACGVPLAVGDEESDPPAPRAAPAATRTDAQAFDDETECALLYTSGTTGRPKGCVLPNGHFLGWGEWYLAQQGCIALRPGRERLLQPLPTFHVNGTGNSFMGMLCSGGAQLILDRFHPRSWWDDAVELGATCFHYLGVMPAILLALPVSAQDRAHGLRYGLGGGVHPRHHAAFEARFGVPLLEGWAMTETGGGGILCAMEEPRHVGKRCVGRPDRAGPPMELRVVDDDGRDLPRGTPGELWVRARGADPQRRFCRGYFKDPAATEALWRDGWLHTGDVVRQGEDGSVYFVDRKKNIIRRSGENIAAAEVEGVIAAHAAVAQVAVVAAPDEIRGEEVLALVVPKSGATPDAQLAGAIYEHCRAQLAYYKAPGWIAFRDTLPTTSTQKVRKADLGIPLDDPAVLPDCHDLRARKRAARGTAPTA